MQTLCYLHNQFCKSQLLSRGISKCVFSTYADSEGPDENTRFLSGISLSPYLSFDNRDYIGKLKGPYLTPMQADLSTAASMCGLMKLKA